MSRLNLFLRMASTRADLVFAAFFVLIIAMLILPLPTVLIDIMLAVNLALTLWILISTIYLKSVLELSTFPTIILLTTVFRVALTVSTARLILGYGDAGHIISAFGNFVVGGNFAVGVVIFLIIAVVQLIVVNKGAERISEVSARFTLDALPGKQMAIDADLRNGDVTKEDAKRRRSNLEKESQFFGAMDGAMRFVKGDTIASLVVVFVNFAGGMAIGMAQRGLKFSEAAKTYTLLSIGDGLVAQIPSIFIAVAAGAIVTRVTNEDSGNLGDDISRQLADKPQAMAVAGVFVAALALVPGFPWLVLLTLAAMLGGGAFLITRGRGRAAKAIVDEAAASAQAEADQAQVAAAPSVRLAAPGDIVVVALAPATLQGLEATGLPVAMMNAGRAAEAALGFVPGPAGFRPDGLAPPDAFIVLVEGVPVERGTVKVGRIRLEGPADLLTERAARIAPAPGDIALDASPGPGEAGVQAERPVMLEPGAGGSGRAVAWASLEAARDLQALGATASFAAGHIADRVRSTTVRYAARTYSLQEANAWLEAAEPSMGQLVAVVRGAIPLFTVVEVARRLLEEGVSLGYPRPILETLVLNNGMDNDLLTERCRAALARQISHAHAGDDGTIHVIIATPDAEALLRRALLGADPARAAPGDASAAARLVTAARAIAEEIRPSGFAPVLLAAPDLRAVTRRFFVSQGFDIPVLCHGELAAEFTVRPVGALSPHEGAADGPRRVREPVLEESFEV